MLKTNFWNDALCWGFEALGIKGGGWFIEADCSELAAEEPVPPRRAGELLAGNPMISEIFVEDVANGIGGGGVDLKTSKSMDLEAVPAWSDKNIGGGGGGSRGDS